MNQVRERIRYLHHTDVLEGQIPLIFTVIPTISSFIKDS